jgi:hypothetical protein
MKVIVEQLVEFRIVCYTVHSMDTMPRELVLFLKTAVDMKSESPEPPQ